MAEVAVSVLGADLCLRVCLRAVTVLEDTCGLEMPLFISSAAQS
jgi:hypothetical protein